VNLLCAGYIGNLAISEQALHSVGSIEGTWAILDGWAAADGILIDAAGIAISCDGNEGVHVAVLEGHEFEVCSRFPVHESKAPGGHHAGSFKLGTVAVAVQIFESRAYRSQNTALPGANVFLIDPDRNIHRM